MPFMFNLKKKLLLPSWRRQFRLRDFCIVSNNCWGAHIYTELEKQYSTPFVGLFFMPDCYLNLLENFSDIIHQPLIFKKESRYDSVNRSRAEGNQFYPIADLAPGLEIQFLHYASDSEARTKWDRRVSRMPAENQKLFFKFCDHDGLSPQQLTRFVSLPFEHKVCFSSSPWPGYPLVVHATNGRDKRVPNGLALSQISHKYFDTLKWLHGGNGVPDWLTIL